TLSLWLAATDRGGTVFSMRNSGDGGPVLDLDVQRGTLQWIARSDGPEINELRCTGKAIGDGQWHHVALVRTASGTFALYIDGGLVNSTSGGRSTGPLTTNLRTLGCERYHVLRGGGSSPYFGGAVDEFALFNRDLTAAE